MGSGGNGNGGGGGLAGDDLRARRAGDAMDKSLDRKLAAIHADPNCREFILADAKDADMAFGIGAPGQSPEIARRRGPVQDARRVPRADAADHPAGAGRHHADVGQLELRADDPRAAVRRLARHPGRPGQRHDRHPPRPRLALRRAARRGRSAPPASTTSSAATSTARPRSDRSAPTSASTA